MKAAVTGAAMEFTLKAGGAKKEAAPKPANAVRFRKQTQGCVCLPPGLAWRFSM